MMERDKKCLGCQAVTPGTTTPLVKTTSMPTKPWRDLALDLMGPLPTIKSLLVTFDYYRGWIEVDVVPSSISGRIIKCLEEDFTGYEIPETFPKYNRSNLLSHEMEKFLDELGIKHKRTFPLWLRANGEVERQSKSLLKAMCAAHAERKTVATSSRIAEISVSLQINVSHYCWCWPRRAVVWEENPNRTTRV